MEPSVVIIGFGAAAMNAIITMRQAGYDGRIVVLSAEGTRPYSPVLTSAYAGGTKAFDECFPWSEDDIASLGVEVRGDCRAEMLDVDAKAVATSSGERFPYTKCLIASGSSPQVPAIPGIPSDRILCLRTMDNAARLREALASPSTRRVLISGSSMVALKVVEACLDQSVTCTLLARSEHILRTTALPPVATRFEQALRTMGVDVRLGDSLTTCTPTADGGFQAAFANSAPEAFDFIVVAHGTTPNLAFVADGTLATDAGVLVGADMRTSNPDVFAAGDVAQALDLSAGCPRVIGLWKSACEQGRCAGFAIAADLCGQGVAQDVAYAGFIPNNTIFVRDAALVSGGSLGTETSRIEMHEQDGIVTAYVFSTETDDAPLIGFNVFSKAGRIGSSLFDRGAMAMKRLVASLCR